MVREDEAADSDEEPTNKVGADPDSAPLRGAGSGGILPTPPPIPQRRAAIGAIQELSEDDIEFLEFALCTICRSNCRERVRSRMGQHPDFDSRSTSLRQLLGRSSTKVERGKTCCGISQVATLIFGVVLAHLERCS